MEIDQKIKNGERENPAAASTSEVTARVPVADNIISLDRTAIGRQQRSPDWSPNSLLKFTLENGTRLERSIVLAAQSDRMLRDLSTLVKSMSDADCIRAAELIPEIKNDPAMIAWYSFCGCLAEKRAVIVEQIARNLSDDSCTPMASYLSTLAVGTLPSGGPSHQLGSRQCELLVQALWRAILRVSEPPPRQVVEDEHPLARTATNAFELIAQLCVDQRDTFSNKISHYFSDENSARYLRFPQLRSDVFQSAQAALRKLRAHDPR